MNGLTGQVSPNVVKTALDKVFYATFDYGSLPGLATAEDAMVFMQDSTDRGAVVTEQYMGPGYFEPRTESEDVASGVAKVGNQKTSSVVNYAKSVDISKNLFDDDQHQVVSKMISDMARLARVTRDKNAFSVYALGFTTETTNDGVALFSNSHVTLNGTTVDNLETGTLTDANLETAINSLIEQKTQDGTLGAHQPACLLVPTALFKEAMIVTKSELRSGTANNDMNYYSQVYPGLQVKYSPFLGATYSGVSGADTAWYLLSANHSVTRFVRQSLQTDLVPYQNQRNNNYIYKAEYREVVDAIAYDGVVGSTGTV